MQNLRFEWDQRKHRVSFEEAETAFPDDQALLLDDPDQSSQEDRFILLGLSASVRVLVVCHCYRASSNIIRLISARKATVTEREGYIERWRR